MNSNISLPQSSPVLQATALSKSFGDRRVLSGLDLAVAPGHRTGLIGENGVGKSTLLRILAKIDLPDDGLVSTPQGLGYLAQEFPHPPSWTVARVLDHALEEVRELERALERAAQNLVTDLRDHPELDVAKAEADYAQALENAQIADVWEADIRAARTLAGLGLGDVDRQQQVGTLSGGQRTRLALAALLIRQPGALLLDEPTNHLDDTAAEYLAAALRRIPGAVLFASHDRVFLDEVATELLDLDATQVTSSGKKSGATWFGGSYTNYLGAKRIERVRWEQQYVAEQQQLKDLRRSVTTTAREVGHHSPMKDNNKFSYGTMGERVEDKVSGRIRSAALRLARLEADQVRKPPALLNFTAPERWAAGDSAGLALFVRDVIVPGRLHLATAGLAALDIAAGSHLLITGLNGVGKSTLLHVLAGDLTPANAPGMRGVVHLSSGARVGLLEQDPDLGGELRTPREVLELATEGARIDAFGLIASRDLNRPVRELSVGQRRRVLLALLISQRPDVLLLDEPTNHISLALADELMTALAGWSGTLVVASHDRWLRREWQGDVVELRG